MEKESVGLEKKDALNGVRWRVGVREITAEVGQIRPPPFMGINLNRSSIDDDEIYFCSRVETSVISNEELLTRVSEKTNVFEAILSV